MRLWSFYVGRSAPYGSIYLFTSYKVPQKTPHAPLSSTSVIIAIGAYPISQITFLDPLQ
jgi:hypothetical protein